MQEYDHAVRPPSLRPLYALVLISMVSLDSSERRLLSRVKSGGEPASVARYCRRHERSQRWEEPRARIERSTILRRDDRGVSVDAEENSVLRGSTSHVARIQPHDYASVRRNAESYVKFMEREGGIAGRSCEAGMALHQ